MNEVSASKEQHFWTLGPLGSIYKFLLLRRIQSGKKKISNNLDIGILRKIAEHAHFPPCLEWESPHQSLLKWARPEETPKVSICLKCRRERRDSEARLE